MKLKIILPTLLLSMLMVGCSFDENESLNEGKTALEKHEYSKATDIFSDILQGDSSNEEARSMYIQAIKMQKSDKYESIGDYKNAIEELTDIEKLDEGSQSILNEAKEKKEQLIKKNDEYEKAREKRRENAKISSSNDSYNYEAKLDTIRQEQEEYKVNEENKVNEEENSKPEENKVNEEEKNKLNEQQYQSDFENNNDNKQSVKVDENKIVENLNTQNTQNKQQGNIDKQLEDIPNTNQNQLELKSKLKEIHIINKQNEQINSR